MPRNKIGQGKRRGLGAGVAELEPVQGNFCLPSRLAHPWGAHAGEPGRRGRCLFPPPPHHPTPFHCVFGIRKIEYYSMVI